MDANTGRMYPLPDLADPQGQSFWPPIGEPITPSDLPSHDDGLSPEDKKALEELRNDVYAERPIVRVSEEVVQKVQLGERELERRRRRRKAAKQARKNNR